MQNFEDGQAYEVESTESYGDFAYVYDEFMDQTPYEAWSEKIHELIQKYGVSVPNRNETDVLASERNLVVDLGCGTGTLTELLYEKGYDVIGIDNSESMLGIAMNKKAEKGYEILYLLQDMRELELYSTIGTVISVCDSVNYILEPEELQHTFELVNNYLFPGGIFIFDFNTEYKYREVIGDTTIAENREDCSFIWDNYYDEEEHINEYDLTVFVKEETGLFRRFTETHYQRGYTAEEIITLLQNAGMTILEVKDSDTDGEISAATERICVVAAGNKQA